jgi:hypothetical protein
MATWTLDRLEDGSHNIRYTSVEQGMDKVPSGKCPSELPPATAFSWVVSHASLGDLIRLLPSGAEFFLPMGPVRVRDIHC